MSCVGAGADWPDSSRPELAGARTATPPDGNRRHTSGTPKPPFMHRPTDRRKHDGSWRERAKYCFYAYNAPIHSWAAWIHPRAEDGPAPPHPSHNPTSGDALAVSGRATRGRAPLFMGGSTFFQVCVRDLPCLGSTFFQVCEDGAQVGRIDGERKDADNRLIIAKKYQGALSKTQTGPSTCGYSLWYRFYA